MSESLRRLSWQVILGPALAASFCLLPLAATHAATRPPLSPRLPPVCAAPAETCRLAVVFAGARDRGRPQIVSQSGSPEERRRMQRQYQEWQTLPPEQKEVLRRRMEELKRLPPQDRDRYQQRYRQWEQLPPEERRRLEDDLKRWDRLSPAEKESIQKRFKP
jgi:hypothetical protein